MAITPIPQNIEQVFSSTTYYIDFYQRQYKWSKEPVERLLDDVFYRFNQDYEKIDQSLSPDIASSRIGSYFLNTYVTNTIDTKVFLVDGQQRFTTITLILIQLYHLGITFDSNLTDWIRERILNNVLVNFKREMEKLDKESYETYCINSYEVLGNLL